MASTIRSIVIGRKASARHPQADGLIRLDRCLANFERHVGEQEARIRQGSLSGLDTSADQFDLQKTHLLLAILSESRERVARNLGRPD